MLCPWPISFSPVRLFCWQPCSLLPNTQLENGESCNEWAAPIAHLKSRRSMITAQSMPYALRSGFEITRMVEIGNQPRLCRAPSQPFLRLHA
jgi:hypothetical protein